MKNQTKDNAIKDISKIEEVPRKNEFMESIWETFIYSMLMSYQGRSITMYLSRANQNYLETKESKNKIYFYTLSILKIEDQVLLNSPATSLNFYLGTVLIIEIVNTHTITSREELEDFWLRIRRYCEHREGSPPNIVRHISCNYINFFVGNVDEKLASLYACHIKVIYIFKGMTFDLIKFCFEMSGISLSSGNNTTKGIISSSQYHLSLICNHVLKVYPEDILQSFMYYSRYKFYSRNWNLSELGITRPRFWEYVYEKINDPDLSNLLRFHIWIWSSEIINEMNSVRGIPWMKNVDYTLKQEYERVLVSLLEVTCNTSKEYQVKADMVHEIKDITMQRRIITSNFVNKHQGIRKFSTSRVLRKEVRLNETIYKDYFIIIKDILNNTNISLESKQEMIENEIYKRFRESIEDIEEFKKKHFHNNNSASNSKVKETLYKALATEESYGIRKTIQKKYPYLWEDKIINLIIAYTTIISLYNKVGYTAVIHSIGQNIIENVFLSLNVEQHKNLYNYKTRRETSLKEFIANMGIITSEIIELGDYYFSLMSINNHVIFKREYNRSFSETSKIQIEPEFINTLQKGVIISPANLPMVCKPALWSKNTYGGYLNNKYYKKSLVSKNSINNNHTIDISEAIYEGVNAINSVEFEINKELLRYLHEEGAYIRTLDVVDDSTRLADEITMGISECYIDTPFYLTVNCDWRGRVVTQSFYISYQGSDLSSALLNFKEGEVLTPKGKLLLYIHGANCHNEGNIGKDSFKKRIEWVTINYDKIIKIDSDLISKAENKYTFTAFCLTMRAYHNDPNCVVKLPILLDATCSGIQHFAALLKDYDLANNVNLLLSTDDDKPHDIYSLLLTQINENIYKLGKTDEKYSHFKSILLDRDLVKLPIMTKIYNVTMYGIAKQIENKLDTFNIIKEKDIILENIYSDYVLAEMAKDIELFKEIKGQTPENYGELTVNNSTDVENIYESLLQSIQGKTNVKKGLYNISRFLVASRVSDKKVIISDHDVMKIAKIIDDTTFTTFPLLRDVYKFFIDFAKVLSKFNLPVTWLTPHGAQITQKYLKVEKKKVYTSAFGVNKTLILKEKTDDISKKDQNLAIIPNIIHSLDANHLMNVVSKFHKTYKNVITIHDCFGTHPNHMWELSTVVKEEFADLYTREDYLDKYYKFNLDYMKTNSIKVNKIKGYHYAKYIKNGEELLIKIPKPPKRGELDLNEVKESNYFIS